MSGAQLGGSVPGAAAGGNKPGEAAAKAKAWMAKAWAASRALATNKTRLEVFVEDALNDAPWGPTGSQMNGVKRVGCWLKLPPPAAAAWCSSTPPTAQPSCLNPLAEISNASFDAESFAQVWRVILRRFDSEPAQWRRIYKVGAALRRWRLGGSGWVAVGARCAMHCPAAQCHSESLRTAAHIAD